MGELASPHGVLIIAAIVFGVGYWLHKRRTPAKPLSKADLDHYQG